MRMYIYVYVYRHKYVTHDCVLFYISMLYRCVYICTCICMCIHICIHTHVYLYAYLCTFVCIYVYIYIYIYIVRQPDSNKETSKIRLNALGKVSILLDNYRAEKGSSKVDITPKSEKQRNFI